MSLITQVFVNNIGMPSPQFFNHLHGYTQFENVRTSPYAEAMCIKIICLEIGKIQHFSKRFSHMRRTHWRKICKNEKWSLADLYFGLAFEKATSAWYGQ